MAANLLGQLQIPFLSDQIPTSLTCPGCSVEFSSGDAIIHHLSADSTCGQWFVHSLPGMEQAPSAPQSEDQGDTDAVQDVDPQWEFINNPFNDNEEDITNWQHVDLFNGGPDRLETTQTASHRVRHTHPQPGKAMPGGMNYLHRMDQDEDGHIRNSENVYYPFASKSEWELADWLSTGSLSQKEIDRYLHLQRNLDYLVSFRTAQDLRQRIESLPEVPRWHCQEIKVGPYKTKQPLILYWRDGLEVVQYLFSNPAFASYMDIDPYREFEEGATGHKRVYGEFMNADCAWEIQSSLPDGHSFLGVIGASDKTPLTIGSGNKEMHPLLLSLANIHAAVRMKATSYAFALAAYLPIPKFLNVSPAVQAVLSAHVYHFAVSIVMEDLKKAAKTGIVMSDPSGLLRVIHTPLVSWIADLPEQHLIACVSSGASPISTATTETFGDPTPSPLRQRDATLATIREACRLCDPCDIVAFHKFCLAMFKLNGVIIPFWADWGDACPSAFLTPDALHQWHKFYFDHCLRWVINIVGGAELDRRLSVLQPRTGTRHWSNGVSTLKQTSGREHRDLEKLLPVVAAGAIPDQVLRALRAITEFIFLGQSVCFYDETLHALREALREFHHYKSGIIAAGGRRGKNGPLSHFQIPKLELMHHVERSTRTMGAPYQWSSDITERCHITHVKTPYRLSNHRNFHEQCCRFLDRQEKQRFFRLYTTLKTIQHAPLMDEIVSEIQMMQLYQSTSDQVISTDGPINVDSLVIHSSAASEPELSIALPGQKGSVFYQPHARISTDNMSAILLTRRPHFLNLNVDEASQILAIDDLRPALGDLLSGRSYNTRNGRRFSSLDCPLPFFCIHAWNKFRIQRRSAQNLLSFAPPQTVQAVPPSPSLPFGRANTVLLSHESGDLISTAMDSKRYVVAQVRAIFEPITTPPSPPLLYVEFFHFSRTHFVVVDDIRLAAPAPGIEMFVVHRNFRSNGRPLGDTVPLDSVCQVVQLVPKFGHQLVPPDMTCDNSLEVARDFYVNSFADKETFHAILSYQ